MTYEIVADRLKGDGPRAIGYAPVVPVINPATGQVVKWRNGRVVKGEKIVWRGNPEAPPMWASPAPGDARAVAAYKKRTKVLADRSKSNARHRTRLAKEQAERIAELEAQLDSSKEEARQARAEKADLEMGSTIVTPLTPE
jgi:hypothetical protein